MNWEKDQQIIYDTYLSAINACNEELDNILIQNLEKIKEVHPILEFIIERLDAVFNLTAQWMVWDAEIILRSVLETFVKFLFIISSEKEEQPKLFKEYWYSLSEIYALKQSEQAKKNVKHADDTNNFHVAYSPLILPIELENELKLKWSKVERKQIEQKWSFTEIVNFLSKNYTGFGENNTKAIESMELLSHSYRMASHVTHGDETGVLIIKERNSRADIERKTAYVAHYLRLLSDCFLYSLWISLSITKYLNLNNKYFIDLQLSLKEIQILTEKYHEELFKDNMYDKFRDK